MAYEVSRALPVKTKVVQTYFPENPPTHDYRGTIIDGSRVAIIPVVRAGLVMSEGFRDLLPFARIGFLGLHQNEEHTETIEYLVKLPQPKDSAFIIIDPMIGTGNTACRAIEILKICNISDEHIHFVGLIAAPEGKERLQRTFPAVRVYVAAVDKSRNDQGRVVPGVGIISDRLFGV